MPSLSFLRSKETLGIDLGSTSLKIVQISNRRVVRWVYKELDPKLCSPEVSPQERYSALTELLKQTLLEQKKCPKTGAISVSGNSVIVRYVKFPKLPPEELEKTIQFEAEPYIPFAIPEVNMGFHILGDVLEDGQQKMETVLVAAKKELIEQKLDVLNSSGIRPVVVDVDAFCLENAYGYLNAGSMNETVILVNIGSNVTNMIVIENGLSKVVRDVFIAGNTINKSLQRIFDCSYEEAEKLKRKGKILVTPDEKEATLAQDDQDSLQVSNTVVTVVKDLVAEIQRSLDFFLSQNPERQVNRLLLCGGSSAIDGLDRYFSQELRISVERLDPFAGLDVDSLPEPELRPAFVIAMGLATRRELDQ
ncbi:MAG: type IV pilus assembly protein PilM [Elusimicrobiota bacterium]